MVLCKIFVNSSVLSPVISSAIMGIVTESAAHGADMCRAEGKRGVHMTVTEEIQALKKEKNAVILAHYYVRPEGQEIADYTGDSFYLSKIATGLEEQTIVFCGVSFMGESAKILNPEKTVLMPDARADCAMAHMADEECPKAVLDLADYVGSTSGIIRYARESGGDEFIICTENGVRAALEKENPEKRFYFTETEPVCEDMKRITLEKIRHVLKTGDNEVRMDARLMEEAKAPLTEMLRLGD